MKKRLVESKVRVFFIGGAGGGVSLLPERLHANGRGFSGCDSTCGQALPVEVTFPTLIMLCCVKLHTLTEAEFTQLVWKLAPLVKRPTLRCVLMAKRAAANQ